ncbi:MAG: autotransporter-associated beta strand repeat-containing protein [Planctomycetota bacterium]|nr:autotransporter-associated beta strand repeat-containing protein [Planctomycetota bacterium]
MFVGGQDYSITGGTLKGAAGADLVVHQRGAGTLTISSTIADNVSATALTKAGAGTLTLAAANTFTGATYLNGGVVSISANNNLGASATGAAVYFSGGALQATAAVSLANGGSNARALVLGAAGGSIRLSGPAASFTLPGAISGEGDLTWTGDTAYPDTLSKLTGTQANTFTGTTFLTCGTMGLQKPSATDALAGDVVVGGGASRAVLTLLANDQIRDSSALTLRLAGDATAGYLRLNGFQETLGGLASDAAGAGIVENAAGSPSTLTIATIAGMDYSFSGVLRNGAGGVLNLVKAGPGSQILAGTNAYTGLTTVSAGTLSINGTTAGAGFTLDGGLLNGSGTIRFLDGNLIDDNAAMDASSMHFDLSALSVASATLVDYTGGSFTGPGDLNQLLTSGSYAAGWRLSDTGSALTAVLVATHAGDVNGDGQVSLLDYNVIKANFGNTYGSGNHWSDGDVNGDGQVGLLDFNIVKAHFGHTTGDSSLTAMPEPAAFLPLLAFLPILSARARRPKV